jgi:hypothetical protein
MELADFLRAQWFWGEGAAALLNVRQREFLESVMHRLRWEGRSSPRRISPEVVCAGLVAFRDEDSGRQSGHRRGSRLRIER